MKDGTFVFDAHTGFWDASPENTKNRFGDAFVETFYAFHTAFNPPDPQWTMDYERVFRKVDPDWYLEEMFVKGEADMAILSTQVLMDFYHTGFVNPERNVIGNIVGTYNDLAELMALAAQGKVTLHTKPYPLEAANDAFDDLDNGRLPGTRAILIPG